jgi:hypothetical protein
MMWDRFINYASNELWEVRHTPRIYVAAILVLGGTLAGIWTAIDWHYTGNVAQRDAEIRSLKVQLEEYRVKLNGATPDQLAQKIKDLTNQVEDFRNKEAIIRTKEWPTLSATQIAGWAAKLSQTPVTILAVLYKGQDSDGLRESLYEVFKKANWPNPTVLSAGYGTGLMIKSRKDEPAALALIGLFNDWGFAVKHDTEGEHTVGKLQLYIWAKP